MATYPGGVYAPRARENRSGVVYDASKKTAIFVEDINKSDDEVIAIETELGTNPKGADADVKTRLDRFEENGAFSGIKHIRVTLTPAQILALSVTPVELIPAPGENKQIQLISLFAYLKFNSVDYTGGDMFYIYYMQEEDPTYIDYDAYGDFYSFISYTGGDDVWARPTDYYFQGTSLECVNRPIYIYDGSPYFGGDSDFVLDILYRIIEIT